MCSHIILHTKKLKIKFEKTNITGGTQCGLGIMGNFASNVVKEMTDYESLAPLVELPC